MRQIFYIGDSTVQFNHIHTYPQTGMSQALGLILKGEYTVRPFGKNGRSTKSFLDEGLFDPVKAQLGPGDYLFIQFGHNDEKADPLRHTEPYGAFQENLRYFIRTAQAAGAQPLLITPIARRLFDSDGTFRPGSHGDYPQAIRDLGRELEVAVADLTARTEGYLASLGDEESKPLFVWPVDNTHLKYPGAVEMVRLLAGELERLGGPWQGLLCLPEQA